MIKFSVLFLCLSVYLSVCLSFSLTTPSVFFLALSLSLPLSLFLSPPSLSVCLSVYLSPLRFDGSETLIRVLCLSSNHYHYGSIYVLLMGFPPHPLGYLVCFTRSYCKAQLCALSLFASFILFFATVRYATYKAVST